MRSIRRGPWYGPNVQRAAALKPAPAKAERGYAKLYAQEILSADDVQVFKPDPRVYRLVCDRLQVPAAAVGFVSSNPWDVSGAASAGLTAFWIRRGASEPEEELGFGATRIVTSITELAL